MVFFPQSRFTLDKVGIDRNTSHRADLHALRLVKMADAFGAFVGVNLVNVFAHVNGLVRALGLAHVAVDALIGDQQCHDLSSLGRIERDQHVGADHVADVAAEFADLADQRAADAGERCVGQQKDGFNLWCEFAVHGGHLDFVIEICHVAEAAYNGLGVMGIAKVYEQTLKRFNRDICYAFSSFSHQFYTVLKAKQRFFVVRACHCKNDLVKLSCRAAHHVQMSQRDRVKGA